MPTISFTLTTKQATRIQEAATIYNDASAVSSTDHQGGGAEHHHV